MTTNYSGQRIFNFVTGVMVVLIVIISVKYCSENPPKPSPVTSVHTEKVRQYHDTIEKIKKEYYPVYQRISESKRPDTLLPAILGLDTIYVNHDSFIGRLLTSLHRQKRASKYLQESTETESEGWL